MDLRAAKIRNASGALIYTVPDHDGGLTHDAEAANVRLALVWLLLVTSVKVEASWPLRTQVGAANLLASSIDAVRRDEIAGTIAGERRSWSVAANKVRPASDDRCLPRRAGRTPRKLAPARSTESARAANNNWKEPTCRAKTASSGVFRRSGHLWLSDGSASGPAVSRRRRR